MHPQDAAFQCWAAAYAGQQQLLQMPMPHPMQPMFPMQDLHQLPAVAQARQFQVQSMHAASAMQPVQAMTAPAMWQPPNRAVATVHSSGFHAASPPQALAGGSSAAAAAASGSPAGASAAPQAASPTVGAAEVLAAVESLYSDRLRPYGRIVRKRLAELSAAAGKGEAEVDAKRLRSLSEGCVHLTVQNEEGGDWSALMVGRADNFVDVYSPQDLYPSELWKAAATYFAGLGDDQMALPGGRYSCAQVLMGRDLGFLSGRSLGEVCHIVQLAISQKKLLGYLNGAVVPYQRSQSMVKERCAERQRPCASAPARGGPAGLATWDMVRTFLEDVLGSMSPNNGFIPLSNIKRLFRSKLRAELSETALGYAKLSELLQDQRVKDLCSVRLQGHGYAVFPKEATAATAAARPAGSAARKGTETSTKASEAVPQVSAPLPTLLHSTTIRREDLAGPPSKVGDSGDPVKAPPRRRPSELETSAEDGPSTPTTDAPHEAEQLTTPSAEASLWTKPLLTPVGEGIRKRSSSLPRNLGSKV